MSEQVVVSVKVVPRASRSEVVGSINGSLKVRISAPPVDGAANAELIRLLARHFGVRKSSVTIISGASSRSKLICVDGIKPSAAEAVLKGK